MAQTTQKVVIRDEKLLPLLVFILNHQLVASCNQKFVTKNPVPKTFFSEKISFLFKNKSSC